MAKSFMDVIQDSPRTGLGIPGETKNTPPAEPFFGFKLRGSWFQLNPPSDTYPDRPRSWIVPIVSSTSCEACSRM